MTPASLAAEAFDRLPRKVRIGAYDFEIVGWTGIESSSAKRYGECSTQEQKIRLCREMSSREKVVDTFLHEVLHAIFWAHCVGEDDKEERTVSMVSSALVQFFRDNPDVLRWVGDTLHWCGADNRKGPESGVQWMPHPDRSVTDTE